MSEENKEVVVDETTEQPTQERENPLQDLLTSIHERETLDPAAEKEEEAVEEPAQEKPVIAEPKVSVAMKAFAKQQGLPDALIATATSDEQLQTFVEFAAEKAKPAEKQEQPPEEESFQLDLPEDEFPVDDSVRKNLEAMNKFYAEKHEKYLGYFGEMAEALVNIHQQQQSMTQQESAKVQQTFDSRLDGYNDPVLGQAATLDGVGLKMRNAVYSHYLDLREANPSLPEDDVLEKALRDFRIITNRDRETDALKADNAKRLGGKPSPLKGEPELHGVAKFKSVVAAINARPHNKEN